MEKYRSDDILTDEMKKAWLEEHNQQIRESERYQTYGPIEDEWVSQLIKRRDLKYFINLGCNTGEEIINLVRLLPPDQILHWFYVDILDFVLEYATKELSSIVGSDKVTSHHLCIHHENMGGRGIIGIPVSHGLETAGLGRRGRYRFTLPDDQYCTIMQYLDLINPLEDMADFLSKSYLHIDIEGQDIRVVSDLIRHQYPIHHVRFEVTSFSKPLHSKLSPVMSYLKNLGLHKSSLWRNDWRNRTGAYNLTVSDGEIYISSVQHSSDFKFVRLV